MIYYQPEIEMNGDIKGHPGISIASFEVWSDKKNLLTEFPNCIPIKYSGDDIEEPTFRD